MITEPGFFGSPTPANKALPLAVILNYDILAYTSKGSFAKLLFHILLSFPAQKISCFLPGILTTVPI
jgi:hypothetical protein